MTTWPSPTNWCILTASALGKDPRRRDYRAPLSEQRSGSGKPPHRYRQVDGIGPDRTESPFLVRDRFPGETSQTTITVRVLETFYPAR